MNASVEWMRTSLSGVMIEVLVEEDFPDPRNDGEVLVEEDLPEPSNDGEVLVEEDLPEPSNDGEVLVEELTWPE